MSFKRGLPNEKGWRELEEVPNPEHIGSEFPSHSEPLLLLHHLSDLHVCDAQSPLRPEYLDRWADPTSPIRDVVGTIGTYRPHSMLTPHVVEAMVTSLNRIEKGPLSGHSMHGAIVTGDTTDNAQENEVGWYLALLDGMEVHPDSGAVDKYEGVSEEGADHYDVKYWHPHGTPGGHEDDEPRALYGFPVIPKLLDTCRAPFKATGLNLPWYAVHGNHDALLQGTVTANDAMQKEMMGDRRYEALPSSLTLEETLAAFNEVGPADFPTESDAPFVFVSPDVKRRALDRGTFAALHCQSPGGPQGHGFSQSNVDSKTMYYATNIGGVRLIVLDSVNQYGGWQGSLDEEQFRWLEKEIIGTHLPVVLASHHPLSKMFNNYSPAERRVCLDEITQMLLKYPQVILWLAGHEHRHHVEWIGSEVGVTGFWQVETASHVDWPQQSRTVEVVKGDDGDIYIGLTVVDHAGPAEYEETHSPIGLASLSRTLSGNVWQKREELGAKHPFEWAEGRHEDRNVVLKIQRN